MAAKSSRTSQKLQISDGKFIHVCCISSHSTVSKNTFAHAKATMRKATVIALIVPYLLQARVFPFRIRYLVVKTDGHCNTKPGNVVDTTSCWSLEGKDDGKCNQRHHTFKEIMFSKNL